MDWNEDGLNDLIVGENNGHVRFYRNIGTAGNPELTYDGNLMVGSVEIDIGSYSHPCIDDWNEDGMKDLLVGASDGRIYLYINVGTNENPVFNTTQYVTLANGSQVDFGSRSGPIVADLNGDGVKDLASGDISGLIYYCQNNGTNANPQLADPVALQTGTLDIDLGSTSRAAAVDWDGDGSMDLMSGSYDARLKLYLQTASTPPAPTCDLTNTGSWIIPASGGTVTYNFAVNNPSGSTVIFDAWTEVQLPNDSFYGPLFVRSDIPLGPYGNISRDLSQTVPGAAPPGYYYLYGYVGNYSDLQVYSQDYVYFYKNYALGDSWFGSWECSGWQEESASAAATQLTSSVKVSIAPNPFNPTATLSYILPEMTQVKLSIYNTAGQKVATLVDGWRDAGTHQAIFDGSSLASGIYIYHLQAGDFSSSGKMMLTK